MKIVATRKEDQNEAAIDPWTAVHFSSGLAAGLMGWGLVPTVLAAVVYDVAEQAFERSDAGQKFFRTSGPETVANVVADAGVYLCGWWLGQRYNE